VAAALSRSRPGETAGGHTGKLNAAITAGLNDPKLREQLEKEGAAPAGGPAADFAAFVRADVQHWAPIVKQSGARPD
jgi:tripartite-type tricarboxylate transporter receptor subunit TctC